MNSQANASRPIRTHRRQHPGMKAFEKYAERIKLDDLESLARRQIWPAMVKRIQAVFDEIEHSPLAGHFGSLYLHPVVPDAYRHLPEGQYLAQLQLTCGTRRLGLDTLEKSEDHPLGVAKTLLEKDAALWFNQSPSRAVTVFMAPYSSAVLKMNEENIILGMYSSHEKLTDKRIRELLSTFFRYLSITSAHHQQSVMDYGCLPLRSTSSDRSAFRGIFEKVRSRSMKSSECMVISSLKAVQVQPQHRLPRLYHPNRNKI